MGMLIAGLILFLGVHSTRMLADGWRSRMLARLGEKGWKGLYSVASLLGFVLMVWGFGQARQHAEPLWTPPSWGPFADALLMLPAAVLLVAAQVPRNHFRSRVHHPQLWGVVLWATGHLLANGSTADAVLFGAWLAWALADLASCYARDRRAGTVYAAGSAAMTAVALVGGLVLYALFVHAGLHLWLFGVAPQVH